MTHDAPFSDPWYRRHAATALSRTLPRVRHDLKAQAEAAPELWQAFEERLNAHWPRLFRLLLNLYGHHYDLIYHMEKLIAAMAVSWLERAADLRELDARREEETQWFQSRKMVGGVLYVDLFSSRLEHLKDHIRYFKELGLTYLHLMPLFAVPRGDNDGGYAVSSYRAVNPDLGSIEELTHLAGLLRKEGISLVLDFVFNHTSDEHEWARAAQDGDPEYEAFYHIFPDREMPDQYQAHLRDIFPTVRPGSFTYHRGMGKWVWTTFNSFQWDLNYGNPAVFRAMAEEMLFLANTGVEILRLDAVAFIWKRLSTDCENQPEAHLIIQAFNAIARIAAPALLFKSEAIVHPDEVVRYISTDECQLSYNPLLMALLWEALATRQVRLIEIAMRKRSRIPDDCAWVNYLRCHDDIGWTFDDDDARQVGIDPQAHRHFLNAFYTGQHPGSFARGLPFQFNPENGDQRISGTLASLAGLEQALHHGDPVLIDMAARRILMLRSIVLSIGGIPLLYLGEEWGVLNDYSFVGDDRKARDSRWVHRPRTPWDRLEKWHDPATIERRIFNETAWLIALRKRMTALHDGGPEVIGTDNPHLFGYIRQHGGQRLLIVANFSEHPQYMPENRLRVYGVGYQFVDHISGQELSADQSLGLGPYQYAWIETRRKSA